MMITVHRGTHEIGGTLIEVASGGTRLILDAGLPLVDANRDPFDSFKALRSTRDQLIAEGTIPAVTGLFTDQLTPPDAILLSHAHLDHTGLLHHSRPEVPIYTSSGTSKMMLAGGVFANRPTLDRVRFRPVKPGTAFQVGDFKVTPFAVDHSTFGCLAFLIEAEGKSILYSGDLRRHGRKPDMLKTLVEDVAPRNIDVLLIEGTHLGSDREQSLTEFDLEERTVSLVQEAADRLVLAAFSPQDVDRLVTMYRTARRANRIFVADAYASFVLHLVSGEAEIPRPTRENGIRVLHNATFRKKNITRLNDLFADDRIEMAEILAAPAKHLMVFRPSMTRFDFDDRLPDRVRVLYGYWPGYLRNEDWIELRRHLDKIGGDFMLAHTSGHIYCEDLFDLIGKLNAKRVIPIHTFEPQMIDERFPNTIRLRDSEAYALV
jgi:ribonuclease J